MDLIHTFELIHQVRESFWLSVPRKHGIINHGQCLCAEVEKFTDLTSTTLKPHDLTGSICGSPKIGVVLKSKPNENLGSRVNAPVFGGSIQKRA
jgi:hypothetical protein